MHESKKNTYSSGSDSAYASGIAQFKYHQHNYFPYELELAKREVEFVSKGKIIATSKDSITAELKSKNVDLTKLTYFSSVEKNGSTITTIQHDLEQSFRETKGGGKRQATRYSVHGLHEYKGKFNPQLARFILNLFGAKNSDVVLDPFCGSGTTLVESAFQNVRAIGIDMNPLAVFLSNAKQAAISIDAEGLQIIATRLLRDLANPPRISLTESDPRIEYLRRWFPESTLNFIEHLRKLCESLPDWARTTVLALGSDLVRDYSLQEPADLRIRRRIAPFPEIPIKCALERKIFQFCSQLLASQKVLSLERVCRNRAICGDARALERTMRMEGVREKFSLVITSPPYATALPYIDTQRLSLVWLGLCSAKEIATLDAGAVGSRELKGAHEIWTERLLSNLDGLPNGVSEFCIDLKNSVSLSDGFRRKSVPQLIYRYYADMKLAFQGIHKVTRRGARLAFVVGSNHTTLGGAKFIINTPRDLADIANEAGFDTDEVIPLDTYHRYGLHSKNAVNSENLTVFTKR